MQFDTPTTLDAALHQINALDAMLRSVTTACHGLIVADNRRVHKDGEGARRSAACRQAIRTLAEADGIAARHRAWMEARKLGGLTTCQLAAKLYSIASGQTGEKRTSAFGDLNALIDAADPDDWLFTVTVQPRYGRRVFVELMRHVNTRLVMRGEAPLVATGD